MPLAPPVFLRVRGTEPEPLAGKVEGVASRLPTRHPGVKHSRRRSRTARPGSVPRPALFGPEPLSSIRVNTPYRSNRRSSLTTSLKTAGFTPSRTFGRWASLGKKITKLPGTIRTRVTSPAGGSQKPTSFSTS